MTQKKIFLTSAIAMGFVAPAFAEPTHTSDTFPDDGYMQADYTYTNAATADNMDSVYEGTVNAVAEYDVIDYILDAGKYLPKDSETITTCPAGSYCAGGETFQYSATTDQGITSCPTGYASSAAGSSSNTQCYRACDINNVGSSVSAIAHATAISGNDYYGSGTDTCEPTACENGWHVKESLNVADTINNTAGENYAYINDIASFTEKNYDGQGAKGQTYYGITDNNTWAVDYGDKGFLYGQGRCSTVQGIRDFDKTTNTLRQPITTHTTSELGSEGGQYCYCNVTGYTSEGDTLQSLSSPWVFVGNLNSATSCASACANGCAGSVRATGAGDLAFRAALFGTAGASPAMCEANTITINWSDVDEATAGQNNEGTATYGEDVRTPFKAATKKGKTFKGWRFSKPTTTQL